MRSTRRFARYPSRWWETSLEEMEWDHVVEPGCYLVIDSGELIRVGDQRSLLRDAWSFGLSPEPSSRLVRLSDDPREAVSELHDIAAEHEYFTVF